MIEAAQPAARAPVIPAEHNGESEPGTPCNCSFSVAEWYFNTGNGVAPNLWTNSDLNLLTFSYQADASTAQAANAGTPVDRNIDKLKITNDGEFDFRFNWQTGFNPPTDSNRFNNGEVVVYNLTDGGLLPFSANTFNFQSKPNDAGFPNGLYAGARIYGQSPDQYIGATSSTNVQVNPLNGVVPETASLALFGSGLAGLAVALRRRQKTSRQEG